MQIALDTENSFFKAKLTYYDDNHKWTAGYETKEWDIYNVFIVAQNGSYSFDGISGYESQQQQYSFTTTLEILQKLVVLPFLNMICHRYTFKMK